MEQARVMHELLQRPEYLFWREEFATGYGCRYSEQPEELVRVCSDSPGIKVTINKDLASDSENILGVLVKSLSESFSTTYYTALRILPPSTSSPPEDLVPQEKR